MIFAGSVLGSLIVPRMSDVYGRKWPTLVCGVMMVLIYVGLFLSSSSTFTICLSFGIGFAI